MCDQVHDHMCTASIISRTNGAIKQYTVKQNHRPDHNTSARPFTAIQTIQIFLFLKNWTNQNVVPRGMSRGALNLITVGLFFIPTEWPESVKIQHIFPSKILNMKFPYSGIKIYLH